MLFSPVYIESNPRCPLDSFSGLTPALFALSTNSFGIISFADHQALTSTESYRYKITRGEGASPTFRSQVVTFSPALRPHNSFRCNTYGHPRKCCKQKAYGLTKSFKCNTYKKSGGALDVAIFRRSVTQSASPMELRDARTFRRVFGHCHSGHRRCYHSEET